MAHTRINHAAIQRSRKPIEIIEEAEQQWIYTEDEMRRTPSIRDGISLDDERTFRYKGYNFITQVGIMLKLPQTTLSSATVFFNRFLMRYSLKSKGKDDKKLHHYQIAATALFLATKVEEHCRKVRELVIACCRVAQKNPNLLVDENTKDYWRWRDTILLNEDVLLEQLCFDLTVESPYNVLFSLLQYYGVEKQKKLRDSAWAFINDSNLTQACLLFTSRTIACAALYCGAKHTKLAFLDDDRGKPWWETQRVPLSDIRKTCQYMVNFYENAPPGVKPGNESIYVGLGSPLDADDEAHRTRLRREQTPLTPLRVERSGSEVSTKRERDEDLHMQENGTSAVGRNGTHVVPIGSRVPTEANSQSQSESQQETVASQQPDAKRVKLQNGVATATAENEPATIATAGNGNGVDKAAKEDDAGSEEGEVEE